MKKTILLAAVAALMSVNSFAQQQKNAGDCREEMIENRADRIADRMGLDDKTEEKFKTDYKKMMQELQATCQCPLKAKQCDAAKQNGQKQECKQMTDAEAAQCLQNKIESQQKRLDIVRTYSKTMGKYLNEKQLLRVMSPVLRQGNCGHKGHGKGMKPGMHGKKNQGKRYGCKMPRPVNK